VCVTDVLSAPKLPRSAIRNAMRCAACKRELLAGEPVYRLRMGYDASDSVWRRMFGRQSVIIACAKCRNDPPKSRGWRGAGDLFTFDGFERAHWYPAKPCSHCGRPVFVDRYRRGLRYFVCGDECRVAIYNANARKSAKQKAPRIVPQKRCAKCDELFTPSRSDAEYCSSKCRQSAYRGRCAS
jgi:hypothetical protein